MQLLSLPVYVRPDEVDVTDQDFLAILRDTILVGNLPCYPSPSFTITWCFPDSLVPTEINFGVLCKKIDVTNKASPHVIKILDWIVTVLSFPCFWVVVAEFFYSFYLGPEPIVRPPCNAIIVVSSHIPVTINCASGSTPDTIPHNSSIMAENFRKLHIFKNMAIWSTRTNILGVYIWPFLYIRIIRNPFVFPDFGKEFVTQWQHNVKKIRSPSLW